MYHLPTFFNFTTLLIIIFLSTAIIFTCYRSYSKKQPSKSTPKKPNTVITSHDIKAIAGDNVMSTQLDLARAYIELNKHQLAKKILEHVIQHGDAKQQHEAEQLISALELS